MSKSTVTIRASAAAAALLLSLLCSGIARGQGSGYRDPASIPSPTGMLYYAGTLEIGPDGHYRATEYPVVTRVDSGSVSAQAGFRLGDVLLSVNGRDGRVARLFRLERGDTRWVIRIRRGAEEKELVMEVPPSMQSASKPPSAPRR
jgi:hypothetical protein